MHARMTIQPLDAAETFFVLLDETGEAIGSGTREVVEVLGYIAAKSKTPVQIPIVVHRPNRGADVRSAIVI